MSIWTCSDEWVVYSLLHFIRFSGQEKYAIGLFMRDRGLALSANGPTLGSRLNDLVTQVPCELRQFWLYFMMVT